jgi:hypothetical protein
VSFEIPHKMSAVEAVRLIAGRLCPIPSEKGYHRDWTKDEMLTLARVACNTEGIKYQFTKVVQK